MGALAHASLREVHVVMHTDSRAATDNLQHSMPNDNIYLLPSLLTLVQRILAQGRIILNCVPRHIGIKGNELADRQGRAIPQNPMIVKPSRKILCHRSNATPLASYIK